MVKIISLAVPMRTDEHAKMANMAAELKPSNMEEVGRDEHTISLSHSISTSPSPLLPPSIPLLLSSTHIPPF